MLLEPWSLPVAVVVLGASAVVLGIGGTKLTHVVARLADKTGLGEALAGAVLLGATTSLPGLVTTVTAAAGGDAELAVSNAVGGIAAQTVFLALADLFHRRANLEHAAASVPNMLQAAVLIALLALVMLGPNSPEVAPMGIHPVSILLVAAYAYGLRLVRAARETPMWHPRRTTETLVDVPEEVEGEPPLGVLWLRFAGLACLVAATGFVVGQAGLSVAAQTPLSGTVVGGLFTAVVTSLPELVTVIAAVRAGALTLAVADIIGGNTFDVLFIAAADIAFAGSVYHAVGSDTRFLLGLTVLLTSVLTAGLVYRSERGIGFEGVAILTLYALGFASLFM